MGPLPVLQTLRDKEPFYRDGIQKERVIVSGRGVGAGVFGVSGYDAPVLVALPLHLFQRAVVEEHSQDFTSAWFIVSGQSWVGFSLASSSWSKSSRVFTRGTRSIPNS